MRREQDWQQMRLVINRLLRTVDCNMPPEMIAEGVASVVEAANSVCGNALYEELHKRLNQSVAKSESLALAAQCASRN